MANEFPSVMAEFATSFEESTKQQSELVKMFGEHSQPPQNSDLLPVLARAMKSCSMFIESAVLRENVRGARVLSSVTIDLIRASTLIDFVNVSQNNESMRHCSEQMKERVRFLFERMNTVKNHF